jgi:hypothetical protein
MNHESWEKVRKLAPSMAKQAEEQVQNELDELSEPLTEQEKIAFWIDFTSYFENKYYT